MLRARLTLRVFSPVNEMLYCYQEESRPGKTGEGIKKAPIFPYGRGGPRCYKIPETKEGSGASSSPGGEWKDRRKARQTARGEGGQSEKGGRISWGVPSRSIKKIRSIPRNSKRRAQSYPEKENRRGISSKNEEGRA